MTATIEVPSLSRQRVGDALSDPARMREVRAVDLGDRRERRLDFICATASDLLQTPVVHMTIVSEREQCYVAAHGLPEGLADARSIGLEYSICQYVVALGSTLVVRDALQERFLTGNLAVTEWGVRSYLGEPVRSPAGPVLGSFCALSYEPRDWTDTDRLILLRMTHLATAALLAR